MEDRFEAMAGVRLSQVYKMTEPVTIDPFAGPNARGSVGVALPLLDEKVLRSEADRSGQECEPGGTGLIVASGALVSPGYRNRAHDGGMFREGLEPFLFRASSLSQLSGRPRGHSFLNDPSAQQSVEDHEHQRSSMDAPSGPDFPKASVLPNFLQGRSTLSSARRSRLAGLVGTRALVNRTVLGLLTRHRFGMDRSLIALAVRGQRSGNVYRFPVQYAEDDNALLVVPAHARNKTWWRNLHGCTDLSVLVAGHWQSATGEVVMPDDSRHRPLTEIYARRWPRVDVTADPIVRIVLARPQEPGPGP